MEERLTLVVGSLDAQGRGVARNSEGKVVFVEGALPGETVEAEVVRRRKSFDFMRAARIVQASGSRRPARCPHFGTCGGCVTQHADARMQVAAKQRWLEDSLARIGKVHAETLLAPLYGEEWEYRRRARFAVRRVAKKGGVLVGFHERRSSYVADMSRCEILPARLSRLIPELRTLVDSLTIRERLPQIELAVGDTADVLVFRHLAPLAAQDESRLRTFAETWRIWLWLQPAGPESAHPFHPAEGPPLEYALPEFGLRIAFHPTDFTQVNQGLNRSLVSLAVRLADPGPGERIGDLYCGLGNFSLPLAVRGAEVTGLEGSEALVARARRNAARNGIAARFERVNLSGADFLGFGPFDKLFVDPPREGAIEVVKSLPADWPRRIVYVSCDPATLARDASVLVRAKGFRLSAAGVVNMFPHTAHVESIALFERQA